MSQTEPKKSAKDLLGQHGGLSRRGRAYLVRILSEFENLYDQAQDGKTTISNLEYLESTLAKAIVSRDRHKLSMHDKTARPLTRAIDRDLACTMDGLIAGIQFGISFLYHRDGDLSNMPTPTQEVVTTDGNT